MNSRRTPGGFPPEFREMGKSNTGIPEDEAGSMFGTHRKEQRLGKRILRVGRPQLVIALALVCLTLLGTTTSANVFVQGGYFNDGPRPAIRNQDFRFGLSYWTVESGYAYQSSAYYRTNPTYPYSLYTYGSPVVKVRQDLPTATIAQLKGNAAPFSCWFLSSNDVAKAQLAVYDATYESICHCYIGGWNYYESPWIGASREAGSLAWANVVARGYVSPTASQAYVRVLLDDRNPNPWVSTWVDDAALTLYDTSSGGSAYGNAMLTFNVWKVDDWPSDTRYRAAYFSVAMSGQGIGQYQIMSIQLRVEMNPQYDDCWWIFCTRKTSQDGTVTLQGVAEGNNRNLAMNPQDQQKARETGLMVAGIGIGAVASILTAPLGAGSSLALGFAADTGTTLLLNWIGESSTGFDTTAYGGADYFTQVRWDYPQGGACAGNLPYVSRASGANDGLWTYRPGVAGYALRFVAEIRWGEPRSGMTGRGCVVPFLQYVGTTNLVGYITP